MSKISVLLCLALVCLSCQPTSTEANSAVVQDTVSQVRVTEDDLILRLSSELTAEPTNQFDEQRNTIVNYAIDNLLNVQPTRSGLFYQIIRPGAGETIAWGDRIRVHYRGYFLDGQVFDSSYKREQPLEIYVGNMIDGWNEGLQLMRVGGKALFLLPAALGYGEEGLVNARGNDIVPPDQILAFEVEVLEKLAE